MMPILLLLAAATADTPKTACVRMEPVAGFEAWGKEAKPALAVGSTTTLHLQPARSVTFKPALSRPAKNGTYGAYVPLTLTRPGRYRVAVSQGAWIDMVSRGERLKSVAHNHGPACSGIAKIVAYDLKPGRYWLQLSDAKKPTIAAMVSSR